MLDDAVVGDAVVDPADDDAAVDRAPVHVVVGEPCAVRPAELDAEASRVRGRSGTRRSGRRRVSSPETLDRRAEAAVGDRVSATMQPRRSPGPTDRPADAPKMSLRRISLSCAAAGCHGDRPGCARGRCPASRLRLALVDRDRPAECPQMRRCGPSRRRSRPCCRSARGPPPPTEIRARSACPARSMSIPSAPTTKPGCSAGQNRSPVSVSRRSDHVAAAERSGS